MGRSNSPAEKKHKKKKVLGPKLASDCGFRSLGQGFSTSHYWHLGLDHSWGAGGGGSVLCIVGCCWAASLVSPHHMLVGPAPHLQLWGSTMSTDIDWCPLRGRMTPKLRTTALDLTQMRKLQSGPQMICRENRFWKHFQSIVNQDILKHNKNELLIKSKVTKGCKIQTNFLMVRFKWNKITLWSWQKGFQMLTLHFCTYLIWMSNDQ